MLAHRRCVYHQCCNDPIRLAIEVLSSQYSCYPSFIHFLTIMLSNKLHHVYRVCKSQCMFYSTKELNVVFFGSDAVSNPTLQLLYSDYLREDGIINKLEVNNCFCISKNLGYMYRR